MRKIIILSLAILSSFFSFAQTNIPQLVSFSAVVRDANNQLLVNTPISIRLTFKQGGVSGPLVYCALHQDSTNANGFISIQLNRDVLGTGCNGAPSTAFENIPWHNGGFWMEVEYQTIPSSPFINLGQLELASSFYAFAAGTAERLTNFNLTGIQNGDVMVYNSATQTFEPGQSGIASVTWENVQNKPTFAPVATSGSYTDLINKPIIPSVPSNVSAFTNDAGYLTSISESQILSISNDTLYLTGGSFVKLPTTSSTSSLLPPTATTLPASNIENFATTINGNINANGLSTTVVFEWGLTSAYGNNSTATQSPVTGTTNVAVSADLTGLQSNTTYHYRIKATNAVDVTYSGDMSFTTVLSASQLTTTAITSILAFSAISGGDITYDGGSPITARGVCWSTNSNPTLANFSTTNSSGTGSFVSNITGLTINTTYYVRAYATNAVGTTYGNQLSFSTGIGASYQGGIIAYFLQPGDNGYVAGQTHGLIAAPSNQSTSAIWGCYGTAIGGTSDAINTGAANTNAIVAGCSEAGYAAKLCSDLVLGGYSDWYLPSKDELNLLYVNLKTQGLGGFSSSNYWSSTESGNLNAWLQYFGAGNQGYYNKNLTYYVRAVRAF